MKSSAQRVLNRAAGKVQRSLAKFDFRRTLLKFPAEYLKPLSGAPVADHRREREASVCLLAQTVSIIHSVPPLDRWSAQPLFRGRAQRASNTRECLRW